jgi:hypothetical protein
MGSIRLLRDCRSLDLEVIWNYLYAVPGERPEDYEAPVAIIPLLEHLSPPFRLLPVLFHRYSAYHEEPAAFGLRAMRPLAAYSLVYGDTADTGSLAHAFEGAFERVRDLRPELWNAFEAAVGLWVETWRQDGGPPRVEGTVLPDGTMRVLDTRHCAVAEAHLLAGEAAATLKLVAVPRRQADISPTLAAVLRELVSKGLVIAYEDEVLSLVTGIRETHVAEVHPGDVAGPVEPTGIEAEGDT